MKSKVVKGKVTRVPASQEPEEGTVEDTELGESLGISSDEFVDSQDCIVSELEDPPDSNDNGAKPEVLRDEDVESYLARTDGAGDVPEASEAALCDIVEEEIDEETPEQISNFINSLLTKSSSQASTKDQVEEEEEKEEEYTPFKMPDSFDIPQEFINEMVPKSSANEVSNPFEISDEDIVKPPEPSDDEEPLQQEKLAEPEKHEQLEYHEKLIKPEKHEKLAEPEKHDKLLDLKKREKHTEPEKYDKLAEPNTSVKIEKEISASTSEVKVEVVEQLTYQKEASIRPRDQSRTKERKAHNPKMDRRTLQFGLLFGESESENEGKKKEPEKKKDASVKEQRSEPDGTKASPPTAADLEDKRKRMKKKLRLSEAEARRAEKVKKKHKGREQHSPGKLASKPPTPVKDPFKPATPVKEHSCHSSCSCVKKKENTEDSEWLVPDSYLSYQSASDSDSPPVSQIKKAKKVLSIGDSTTEEEEQETSRRKEQERKVALSLRGGGEVLSRVGGRLSVSIQSSPRNVIIDLWQYQAMLDQSSEGEEDTPQERQARRNPVE